MAKLAARPKGNSTPPSIGELTSAEVERKADAFISKGGKAPAPAELPSKNGRGQISKQSDPDAQIGITVKLLVKERNKINELRESRPSRTKISIHEWIIEAIQEKMKKESSKYKT